MRIFVDDTYLQQRSALDFRATCEDCVHFDDLTLQCSLTFPTAPHLGAAHAALASGDVVLFCKTFEME